MIHKATGLLRRLPGHHLSSSPLLGGGKVGGAANRRILQPVLRIHNQMDKPSCVGQSHAAGVESMMRVVAPETGMLRAPFPVSSVDIWTDARRRQGDLNDPSVGTRSEFAILSLMQRGISPYVKGEDARPIAEDMRIAGLSSELSAYDRRQVGAKHYCISPLQLDAIAYALEQGMVVTLESGCKEKYFTAPFDTVLGVEYRSGDEDGHSERIYGRIPERQAWAIQGSWGSDFGGWKETDGTIHRGCVLVSDDVIKAAWNIDAIKIRA